MAQKIKISKEECEKLENLHYEYNTYATIENSFLDTHKLDPDGSSIESPVFTAYHAKSIAAFRAYEEEKAALMEKYDLLNKDWRLDFKTCEITIN